MYESKLFIALIMLIMTSIFGSYFSRSKQLLSPGFVILVWWDFLIMFFLLFDDGETPYKGIIYTLGLIAIYEVGFWVGSIVEPSRMEFTHNVKFNYVYMKKWLVFTSLIIIIPIIISFVRNGGLNRSLISTVSESAYQYYTTENSQSIIDKITTQITSITIYGNAFLGGVYFLAVEKENKKFASIVFLPGILQTVTTSGKLGFIITVFMFAIGMIAYRLKNPETVTLLSYWRIIRKYGIYGVGALFMLFMSLLFRFGQINSFYINETKRKFVNYAFGSVAAFNIWFNSRENESLGYGSHTFTGILNTFGIVKRERGVYTEFATSSFWNSNIYTAFRGIILDYGFWGSIIFMFIMGIIAGHSYNTFVEKKTYGTLTMLSFNYLFVLFSIFNFPFVYLNLTVFIPVILMIYCYFQNNYEANISNDSI